MTRRMLGAVLLSTVLAGAGLAADKGAKVITDDMINDNVRIKLASDQIVKGGALTVDVKQGVVTLGGQVESTKQKERATKLAKQVKGVKQVINNIGLKESK